MAKISRKYIEGDIVRWVADASGRRVPNFVVKATGIRTKRALIRKYGHGAAWERTESGGAKVVAKGDVHLGAFLAERLDKRHRRIVAGFEQNKPAPKAKAAAKRKSRGLQKRKNAVQARVKAILAVGARVAKAKVAAMKPKRSHHKKVEVRQPLATQAPGVVAPAAPPAAVPA
jgi:hypothetical protein